MMSSPMSPMQGNLSRSNTGGLSRSNTGGLSRSNTGEMRASDSDIQNVAQDIEGGQGPVYSDGQPYPVLAFGFCSTRGRRPYNEDRLMMAPRLGGENKYNFYGVLDGHGGPRASEFAKNDLSGRLARRLQGRGPLSAQDGDKFFHQVFVECDQAFLQQAKAGNYKDGTTACTVFISGTDLFCANVGDSEAIVCEMSSGSPKAVKIAKTHKPADASEADRIRKLGGTVEKVGGVVRVNKDLSVSRAIGDAGLKQFVIPDPSVTYRKLTQSDEWLVIASDGLWDYMGPNTAAIVAHRTCDAQQAARKLVEAAISAGTTDNVGVVVVDLRHIWERDPAPPKAVSGCSCFGI